MTGEQDSGGVQQFTWEELAAWAAAREGSVLLLGLLERPGVVAFNVCFEYRYHLPGTKANEQFDFVIMKFGEMFWSLAGIPKQEFTKARKLLRACGLRMVEGLPTIWDGDQWTQFPVQLPNLRVLENLRGHPIYAFTAEMRATLHKNEQALVAEIFETSTVPANSDIEDRLLQGVRSKPGGTQQ